MEKSRNYIFGIVILFILVILTLIGWFVIEPDPIIMQGTVKVKEINVASKLVGRVVQKRVDEGNFVTKGDTLILLSTPEIDAKLAQAKAVRAAASALNEKADAGARVEQIEGAKNLWQKAEAASELYGKTYDRVSNLYDEGVVPLQKLDEVETEHRAAKLTASAAKSQYEMAKKGARKEDKEAALAQLHQANSVVDEVEIYVREAAVIAPVSGEISEVVAEVGELVNAGYPIVSLINMENAWISFNIRETNLAKFTIGKKIKAIVPALGNKEVELEIDYIKVLGDFAVWRATKARGDFDSRTFDVKCSPTTPIKDLRPGMTVIFHYDEIN